jgi:hypothetical protein
LQFTYPYAYIKDVQATREAFRPLKENIQYFIEWNLVIFYLGHFFSPVSGSVLRIRIQIQGLTESGYGSGSTTLLNTQKQWRIRRKNEEYAERKFLSKQYLDPWSTDLKLLEVVDGLSDGPVYLLYLGGGRGWGRSGKK